MTCRSVVGLLVELLERTLRSSDRAEVQAHFDRCPACACFAETYRKTIVLFHRTHRRQASPEFKARLVSYLRDKAGGRGIAVSHKSG